MARALSGRSATSDQVETPAPSAGTVRALAEYSLDGHFLRVSDTFSEWFGYRPGELVGQHHRVLLDPIEAGSEVYRRFWESLAAGQSRSGEFQRLGRRGEVHFVQGFYTPHLTDGRPEASIVVCELVDVTAQRNALRDLQDQTHAVVEFLPDGTILTANQRFLDVVGYSLDAIRGAHHRRMMPPGEADTPAYREHWEELAQGRSIQGEFRRVDRRGNEIWLHGAYNPMVDSTGQVVRIVKQVVDITGRVSSERRVDELGQVIAEDLTQMRDAITELSTTTNQAAELARHAGGRAQAAAVKIDDLKAASTTIGEILNVIGGLASQTDLLALNATIEAARAGEAGQGFAVVAHEVKQLAGQTSKATADINTSVQGIQSEIATVIDMIQDITNSASDVSGLTTDIAGALEQQTSLVAGIDRSADELLAARNER